MSPSCTAEQALPLLNVFKLEHGDLDRQRGGRWERSLSLREAGVIRRDQLQQSKARTLRLMQISSSSSNGIASSTSCCTISYIMASD